MSCFSKGCHLWALALALLLAFPLSGKTVVKMATLAPIDSPWHNLLIEMGQAWRDATDGEVILRIYPGGVAGDERDMIRKIRIGQLHAAAVTIEGLTEISRDMNVFYIPMLVNSFSELDAVRKPLMHELENDLSDGNFKLLAWADVGWAYWFSRDPIRQPADLKRMKQFSWAGDYAAEQLWRKAGFQPIPLASIDVLTSLQTGVIDAFSTSPMVALSFQWFALAPNMLDLKWGPIIGALIISEKRWKSIPTQYHADLQRISARMEADARAIIPEMDAAVSVMKENGLVVHQPTDEEFSSWKELTRSMYPYIRGSLVPEAIFDKAIDLKTTLDLE